MNDLQAEDVLERIEVTIAVKQGMLVDEAERGDEAVDGLPHRLPARAKCAVVARRGRSQLDAPSVEHLEPTVIP